MHHPWFVATRCSFKDSSQRSEKLLRQSQCLRWSWAGCDSAGLSGDCRAAKPDLIHSEQQLLLARLFECVCMYPQPRSAPGGFGLDNDTVSTQIWTPPSLHWIKSQLTVIHSHINSSVWSVEVYLTQCWIFSTHCLVVCTDWSDWSDWSASVTLVCFQCAYPDS